MWQRQFVRGFSLASCLAGLFVVSACTGDFFSKSFLSSPLFAWSGTPDIDAAHTLVNRALASEKNGDRASALKDIDAALAMNVMPPGEAARARYDRGVTLDELGRTDEALEEYTQALILEPQFPAALNNRANILRRQGNYSDARANYEASLAAGNKEPQYPYYGLGQIAEAQGDAVAALDCYRKALAANPDYALAAERLAKLDEGQMPRPLVAALSSAEPQRLARTETRRPKPSATDTRYADADPLSFLRPSILGQPERRAQHPSQIVSSSVPSNASQIQLGAYRDEMAAADNWNRLVAETSGLLGGLKPQIVPVDLPQGRYYRLRTAVGDGRAASSLCTQLKTRGIACLPVKG